MVFVLITKTIVVYGTPKNVSFYSKLGYDIKYHQSCEINIYDLCKSSKIKVAVKCDYCGKEFEKPWAKYLLGRKTVNKDCCKDCIHNKYEEVCNEIYGVNNTLKLDSVKDKRKSTLKTKYDVENPAQIESAKEKTKETNLKKYGYENVFQVKEFQEKMHNTMEEKYNVKNALENEIFLQKAKDTCIEHYGSEFYICSENGISAIKRTNIRKYGNEYAIASKEIKEKIKKSCQEKYGVDYPLQSKEIQEKARISLQKNGNRYICCSRQQLRLSKLYECELNKKIGNYYADLVFGNIICEYDDGGHYLNVLFGEKTQEDFDREEKQREDYFVSMGYKLFRIINTTDKIMSDSFYLDLKEYCLNIFSNTNYNICYYNIKDNAVKYR